MRRPGREASLGGLSTDERDIFYRRCFFAAVWRQLSWYEALCLMPQRLSTLPPEDLSPAAAAAAAGNTTAAADAVGTAAAAAAAATTAVPEETLHLLSLVLPPLGGASLRRDRLETVCLNPKCAAAHPFVSSLLQEKPLALPQSLSILTLALPRPRGAAALQLRRFLAYRRRPLVLEILLPGPPAAAAAPQGTAVDATSAAAAAAAAAAPLLAAAAAAGEAFHRSLELAEGAVEQICCPEETLYPPYVEPRPLRLLLQYVSSRVECLQCGRDPEGPPCSRCTVAWDAAAAAAVSPAGAAEAEGPSSFPVAVASSIAPPARDEETVCKEKGQQQPAAEDLLSQKVFAFLCESLLAFLTAWEEEDHMAGDGETDPGVDRSQQQASASAGDPGDEEQDKGGGILGDVLVPQPSVHRECLAFGGLPRGCDDTQTGELLLSLYRTQRRRLPFLDASLPLLYHLIYFVMPLCCPLSPRWTSTVSS